MLSVSTLLISIQSLLGGMSPPSTLITLLMRCAAYVEPNNRSPLNVEAADLWDNVEAVSTSFD